MVDKIVREHRGGFCYELNSAFGWLLRQLVRFRSLLTRFCSSFACDFAPFFCSFFGCSLLSISEHSVVRVCSVCARVLLTFASRLPHFQGFDVQRLSARMNTITPDVFGPPFDHLCLRVNGTWLCDVTASYAMGPLELRTIGRQPQRSHGVLYRLAEYEYGELVEQRTAPTGDEPALRQTGELMLLKHNYLDGWLQTYIVDLRERRLPEFADMCLHHQSSPRTQFTRGRFCTIATSDIWMALRKVRRLAPCSLLRV